MIRDAIAQLVDGISLDRAQSTQVMEEIMTGEATPAQIGAFTVALRQKGEDRRRDHRLCRRDEG